MTRIHSHDGMYKKSGIGPKAEIDLIDYVAYYNMLKSVDDALLINPVEYGSVSMYFDESSSTGVVLVRYDEGGYVYTPAPKSLRLKAGLTQNSQ